MRVALAGIFDTLAKGKTMDILSTVLVVIWLLPSGSAGVDYPTGVTLQEFSSMKQCQYVADLIKQRTKVKDAFCVKK